MTRIATSFAYQNSVSTLQQRQADMMESQERLVSGKSVMKASDDPTAAARAPGAPGTPDPAARGASNS